MNKVNTKRRWGCGEFAFGCMGMFLGAVVVIGGEVYLAILGANEYSKAAKQLEEDGPSQSVYDSMCASGASTTEDICQRMREEMAEAKKRKAAKAAAEEAGQVPRLEE